MADIKIKVDDKGNLTINACDLFETLEDDSKKEIIEALAWESPMWDELKRGIREDFAGENYNSEIYKARLSFLQGEDVDRSIKDLFKELLNINKKLNKQLTDWRNTYYQWLRWNDERTRSSGYERTPVEAPKYEYVTATNTELETVLKALGITQDMIANPLGVKDEVKVAG